MGGGGVGEKYKKRKINMNENFTKNRFAGELLCFESVKQQVEHAYGTRESHKRFFAIFISTRF